MNQMRYSLDHAKLRESGILQRKESNSYYNLIKQYMRGN